MIWSVGLSIVLLVHQSVSQSIGLSLHQKHSFFIIFWFWKSKESKLLLFFFECHFSRVLRDFTPRFVHPSIRLVGRSVVQNVLLFSWLLWIEFPSTRGVVPKLFIQFHRFVIKICFRCLLSRKLATPLPAMSVSWSDGPSIKRLVYGRFMHYCSCPNVWLAFIHHFPCRVPTRTRLE